MMGLKTVPWRNAARLAFVWCAVMALCALFIWEPGLVVGRVLDRASGMFHRTLVLLRWPLMMIFPFFTTLTLYFVNILVQSSSQSWPVDTRDPDFRLSRMWPDIAELESSGASGILTDWVALIEFPLAALTVVPVFFWGCVQEDFWEV